MYLYNNFLKIKSIKSKSESSSQNNVKNVYDQIYSKNELLKGNWGFPKEKEEK